MKKQFSKKKLVTFSVLGLFSLFLVTAVLVPFLSNTVSGDVKVKSPITIVITDISDGGTFDANSYSIALFGGETYIVDTDTIVHTEVTGHIAESVIYGFNGDGMTITYKIDGVGKWEIPGCQNDLGDDGNTYYYIGNPKDILPGGITITSTTTVDTELNLEPKFYTSDTTVILAEDRKCSVAVIPL